MKNEVSVWDFIEKYYPNYSSCDSIAECNDLQKILGNEIEGVAEKIYNEILDDLRLFWGGGLSDQELRSEAMKVVEARYNEVHVFVYERAIEEFLKQQL